MSPYIDAGILKARSEVVYVGKDIRTSACENCDFSMYHMYFSGCKCRTTKNFPLRDWLPSNFNILSF